MNGCVYLHSSFHGCQVSKGDLPCSQLPEHDGKAPHVCCLGVDGFWRLDQGFWGHPGRMKGLASALEGEGGVGHVDAGSQLVVGQAVDLKNVKKVKNAERIRCCVF